MPAIRHRQDADEPLACVQSQGRQLVTVISEKGHQGASLTRCGCVNPFDPCKCADHSLRRRKVIRPVGQAWRTYYGTAIPAGLNLKPLLPCVASSTSSVSKSLRRLRRETERPRGARVLGRSGVVARLEQGAEAANSEVGTVCTRPESPGRRERLSW